MYSSALFCSVLFSLSLTRAQQLPPQVLAAVPQQGQVPGQPGQGAQQLTLNPTLVNQASLTTGNEGGGKPSTPSAQSPNNFVRFYIIHHHSSCFISDSDPIS